MTEATLKPAAPSDSHVAARNAVQLVLSLFATYGVGLLVRMFFLPRALGKEAFGTFTAADALANSAMLVLTFGMEAYVQKEVSVRKEHATDFVLGLSLVRLGVGTLLIGGMAGYLLWTGQPRALLVVSLLIAWMYLLFHHNNFCAALLHASATVSGLAVVNVATKVLWGVAIVAAVAGGLGVLGVALAWVFSEAVKAVLLYGQIRKYFPSRFQLNWKGTVSAMAGAFPFLLNSLSLLYGKLDINMMSFWKMNAAEIGWYGVAGQISGITLMLMPALGGAVFPLFSRAAAKSAEELSRIACRTVELVFTFGIAGSILLALGADLLVQITAGPDFLPAIPALRILCANFPLTYVAVLSSYFLASSGRIWTLVLVSVSGLMVNPVLNLLLIRPLSARGTGWSGVGAALATVGTELFVTSMLLFLVGRRVFDRRSMSSVARILAVGGAVILLHLQLEPLVQLTAERLGTPGLAGMLRVAVDAVVYAGLAVWARAVRIGEVADFLRAALGSRRQPVAP